MIIYSVTISIDKEVEKEWLKWMQEVHIPDVMNTQCFVDYKLSQLIYPNLEEQASAVTYNIQYRCVSLKQLEVYRKKYAAALQSEHSQKFANKFQAFRTILKEIQ